MHIVKIPSWKSLICKRTLLLGLGFWDSQNPKKSEKIGRVWKNPKIPNPLFPPWPKPRFFSKPMNRTDWFGLVRFGSARKPNRSQHWSSWNYPYLTLVFSFRSSIPRWCHTYVIERYLSVPLYLVFAWDIPLMMIQIFPSSEKSPNLLLL